MTQPPLTARVRAELLAARATGAGCGLIVLMLVWLVGQRIAALLWGTPLGPTVAILTALALGLLAAVLAARRFVREVRERPVELGART